MRNAIVAVALAALLCPFPAHADGDSRAEQRTDLLRAAAERPADPGPAYDLACLEALSGATDPALEWLGRAIAAGFDDVQHLAADPDLASVRDTEGYRRIVDSLEQRLAAAAKGRTVTLVEGKAEPFVLGTRGTRPWVEGTLAFDTAGLHVRATVHDDHFRDGERAWRAGDGFLLNVSAPGAREPFDTARVYGLGFAREQGRPVGVLVEEAGVWSLRTREEITPRIDVDAATQTARYEIDVPWSFVPRLRPWVDGRAGLNIIYVSRDDAERRTFLKWIPDPSFDTESTDRRRFVPLRFRPSPQALRLGGELTARLVNGGAADLALVVHAPSKMRVMLSVDVVAGGVDSIATPVAHTKRLAHLVPGPNVIGVRLPLPADATGLFTITARCGGQVFRETFARIDGRRIVAAREDVERLAADAQTARERAGSAGLLLRLQELDRERETLDRRVDPARLAGQIESGLADILAARVGTPFFARPGYAFGAFTSTADGSRQPLSLWLPKDVDPLRPVDVIVALHGSGVDEVDFVRSVGGRIDRPDTIIAGPRGRGLSDWWLGVTEQDAIDAIAAMRAAFNVRRVVVYGFSMGGYGAWRMAFRHPELLTGAIVASGSPSPLRGGGPDDDLSAATLPSRLPRLLVLHGTEDRSVPFAPAEAFVQRVRSAGHDVTWLALPGKAHGDYDTSAEIRAWLDGLP